MSYAHIENHYKDPSMLMFRRIYALEKIHGTSAHVSYRRDQGIHFTPGSADYNRFGAYFARTTPGLRAAFDAMGHEKVTVYGEAYGGSLQRMRLTYGMEVGFVAFDVKIGEVWLAVPNAVDVCRKLGIEFVPFVEIDGTQEAIDAERDKPSEFGERRGFPGRPREGVVLKPLRELTKNNGERMMAKHKHESFAERATPASQMPVDPARTAVLEQADAIAMEWVNEMRLEHIIDRILRHRAGLLGDAAPEPLTIRATRDVIFAMVEDVQREAAGEIVWSRDAERAVSRRTQELFKAHLDKPGESA